VDPITRLQGASLDGWAAEMKELFTGKVLLVALTLTARPRSPSLKEGLRGRAVRVNATLPTVKC